jgi:hypothetical protein
MGHPLANRNHFESKLVAGCARESEKRKFPEVTRNVRSTNPHAMRAHDGLAGTWILLVRTINDRDAFRFGEFDGLHSFN